MYWPGVDGWPPPPWVWLAAAVMTVVTPLAFWLLGAVGIAIYIVIVGVCLFIDANARLKRLGAQEFWESRPKDD
jgi:hypothetical protein